MTLSSLRSPADRLGRQCPWPVPAFATLRSETVTRKVNRETVVLLGWGRAILLQLAHPLVAAGVADYTRFHKDHGGYVRRARRTVGAMLALTFGTDAEARAIAARINAIHDRVSGTLREAAGVFPAGTVYSARDPELLRWVHATLLESVPLAYELFVGPLTREEKDRYCLEAGAIGPLLRIGEDLLPHSVADLEEYMQRMYASGAIAVTDEARSLARALLSPPLGPAAPVFRVARLTTIGLLPPMIREGYGFAWTPRDERALGRTIAFVRRLRALLPPVLREWPAARERLAEASK